MGVSNITNITNNNGREVPNQFKIITKSYSIFQSYDSIIVAKDKESGKVYLGEDWKYSATTSKYRSIFLNGETTKETQTKLGKGTYTLLSNTEIRKLIENT
jgi:hypothetical protein